MIVLIESDWNLKWIAPTLSTVFWICINRIRLEFKVKEIKEDLVDDLGINRIRLEFKVDTEVVESVIESSY